MAEFILKAMVKARGLDGLFYIESAAISTEEIGNPIYPPAKRCLAQHGIWFDPGKRARQITGADYTRFCRDVADPWYTGDFEETFQDLLEGCVCWLGSFGMEV